MSIKSLTPTKLLAAAALASVVSLALADASPARKARNLGPGPLLSVGHPVKGSLPRNKPLIVVTFSNHKVVSVTGTAVPRNRRKTTKNKVTVSRSTTCSVNFTHSTQHSSGKTTARWYAGVGCSQSMFLFGQAFLRESATKLDGTGQYYQGVKTSAASGQNATIIKASRPSLYIEHLLNVYFPNAPFSGSITVEPASGQVLNAASKCVPATQNGYGTGVHCDLFTNRFT